MQIIGCGSDQTKLWRRIKNLVMNEGKKRELKVVKFYEEEVTESAELSKCFKNYFVVSIKKRERGRS